MHHGQYVLLLGACLLLTLPLELVFGARVYRRPWLAARTVGLVLAIFGTWDAVAYARHHWAYDLQYFLGPELLGGLPLEELLFFVVIPLCALLTYSAVGTCLGWVRRLLAGGNPAGRTAVGRAGGQDPAGHGGEADDNV